MDGMLHDYVALIPLLFYTVTSSVLPKQGLELSACCPLLVNFAATPTEDSFFSWQKH